MLEWIGFQQKVKHTGDQSSPNNYVQADIGVGKWIENGEAPEDEIGPSITFEDTDDNGASHLNHVNYHRASSYDWDMDGCGWAEGVAEDCADNGGTLNKTQSSVYHEGKSALASFNTNGWSKTEQIQAVVIGLLVETATVLNLHLSQTKMIILSHLRLI